MPPSLLLNENFPAPSVRLLRAAGLDARSVAEVLPSANDAAVLALAVAQSRWLVTFDRDYGELIFRRNLPAPPAVILLRVPHYRPDQPAEWILRITRTPLEFEGQLVVFNGRNLRVRPLLRVVDDPQTEKCQH